MEKFPCEDCEIKRVRDNFLRGLLNSDPILKNQKAYSIRKPDYVFPKWELN